MRLRPASLSACAFFGSADALVVSVRSTGQRREHLDQVLDADAQQRLAAGEAELGDADLYRCGSKPGDLLEA